MAVIEAVLAVIGLLLLVLLALVALSKDEPDPPPPEDDLAAPYRQGLHAAIRMQAAARDLEQQIYAEAARQASNQPEVVDGSCTDLQSSSNS
jgi:hypothetical protein